MKINWFMFVCVVVLCACNCVLVQLHREHVADRKKLINDANEIFERSMTVEAQNLGLVFEVIQLKARNEELTRQVRWLDAPKAASR